VFHTLRFRLIVTLVLIVVAAVGIVAFFGTVVTTRTFTRYEEHGGMMRHRRFEMVLTQHYAQNGSWADVQPQVERMGQITGERIVLADEEERIVADSAGELIGQPVGQDWPPPSPPIIYHGARVGTLYTDFPGWGGKPGSEDFLAPVNRTLLLIAVAAGLGAVLLILGLSRRILAPVEALTAAVRRMEAGDLSQRVEITSRDEIGDLARAFNAMADGLARLEELRRQLVTDVAHELRTPLSNIRGYLEAIQDGVVEPDRRVIDSLHEETMLLNRLVDDLQDLSLAEAGQLRLERRPVALADVVDRAVEAARPRAAAKGVALQVDLPGDLPPVDVDPQRIGQVLRNLLDNGLTHTGPGGEIAVTAQVAGRWVEVSVRDTGAGIAAEDLPYVFERFYRADKSRSRATGGAGLGLAIVKQLVEAHGGRIEVESRGEPSWSPTVGEPSWSPTAEGTRFTFTLPVGEDWKLEIGG
jgi:signal transduction histidine kinase